MTSGLISALAILAASAREMHFGAMGETPLVITIGLSAGALLLWASLRWFRARPIKELVRATERVAKGDYQVELPSSGQGELSQLVEAFNVMARRLRENTAALSASENRFRRVIESDLVGIIFWGSNGTILEANDVFLRMVGYSRAELKAGKLRRDAMTPPEYHYLDELSLSQIREHGVCA